MSKIRDKGDGCIIKRGNSYSLRARDPVTGRMNAHVLYLNGKKCTTKIEAEEAARIEVQERRKVESIETKQEMLVQIAQKRQLIAAAKYKVGDMWKEFLSSPTRLPVSEGRLSEMERVVKMFSDWCFQKGIKTLAEIEQDVVLQFLSEASQGLSARSYNAYREILKSVFSHIFRHVGMETNPMDGIKLRKMVTQTRKVFTSEQVAQIIDCFDMGFFHDAVAGGPVPKEGEPRKVTVEYKPKWLEEYRIIILLAIYTACRLEDAVLMRWDDIDMEKGRCTFTPHKTAHSSGIEVEIPFHPKLWTALAHAQSWRTNEYVCPHVADRYGYNKSGVSKTVQKLIFCATKVKITAERGAGRARAANQYGMHSFRHTFASFCGDAGVPEAVVQTILGHSSPAMTAYYYHASMSAKAKAVAAIELPASAAQIQSDRERLIEWARSADEGKVKAAWEFALKL